MEWSLELHPDILNWFLTKVPKISMEISFKESAGKNQYPLGEKIDSQTAEYSDCLVIATEAGLQKGRNKLLEVVEMFCILTGSLAGIYNCPSP